MSEITEQAAPKSGVVSMSFVKKMSGPLVGLILLCVFFSLTSEFFLSARNGLNILDQVTVLGILAIGMTLVIVIGGIDLSVGSVLAFSMMMMGVMQRQMGLPLELAIIVGIATGALCGLVSGLLITVAKLPAFIATLAVMSVTRGLANILTEGKQIVGYPDWFTSLATVRQFGFLSMTVATFIVLAIIAAIILKYRPAGRNLFAIGGNPEVARLAGINVNLNTCIVYALSGALAGLAAVAFAARLDSSQPSAGLGYELDTIAAVVIGGASLSGGVGSIFGTVVGVFIIGVLRNGLNLLGVSPFIQQVLIGVVIAAAVTFDTLGRKRR
ncbi:ribose transport system permease protein [Neorhizobium huautlense]|uniref:Ribose transport system permease protein n=1 Tax=Neorhizobium huautlense TaxID=67774 RepID=A0ABT9PT97_9HYPH|nr:ABC transporter permease [Neorhizobium huautlense]MDP9837109.1 ribose transport system permease protein [Neorhizobium huautlense]